MVKDGGNVLVCLHWRQYFMKIGTSPKKCELNLDMNEYMQNKCF